MIGVKSKTLLLLALCLQIFEIKAQIFGGLLNTLRLFESPFNSVPEANFQYEYDFVVIGAGSGGSVVASRLSENANFTVLLLEAGIEENLLTDVPLVAPMQSSTPYNWGYKFEKQASSCLGLVDQRCKAARGKAVGGTSVINFLIYTRGNKLDYDEWENLGNKGWSYNDVLKYFIKSEDCTKCNAIDEEYHGKGGYLSIEHPHYDSPLLKRFLKAGLELGYKNTDPNGRQHLGFSEAQATMENGRRCSAAKAFLKRKVRNRPNLQIVTRARVTKILIDPFTKTAHGIEVIKNRERFTIKAKKEVILSAGTFNSPQLLMLSGIGPKKDLEKFNIPLIQDLKVGYNLQDHVSTSALLFLVNQSITVSDLQMQNPLLILDYVLNGNGPYTIPGGALGLGFIKTKHAQTNDDYPDIELVLGAGGINGDNYGTLRSLIGIPDDLFAQVYGPVRNTPGFSIAPVLMRPKSRGRVILKDKNPLHWPLIYSNYFQNENDLEVFLEGIKAAIEVARSHAFRDVNTTLHTIPIPKCAKHQFESDDYWKCFIRNLGSTLGHPVGTCKMGPDSDPDSVVNSRLQVKGVKALRVVDASIMPNIVAGHTNSVVMMIGEKAADMIKEDWGQ